MELFRVNSLSNNMRKQRKLYFITGIKCGINGSSPCSCFLQSLTFFVAALPVRSFVRFVSREGLFVEVHRWRVDKLSERFHSFRFVVKSSDWLSYIQSLRIEQLQQWPTKLMNRFYEQDFKKNTNIWFAIRFKSSFRIHRPTRTDNLDRKIYHNGKYNTCKS